MNPIKVAEFVNDNFSQTINSSRNEIVKRGISNEGKRAIAIIKRP